MTQEANPSTVFESHRLAETASMMAATAVQMMQRRGVAAVAAGLEVFTALGVGSPAVAQEAPVESSLQVAQSYEFTQTCGPSTDANQIDSPTLIANDDCFNMYPRSNSLHVSPLNNDALDISRNNSYYVCGITPLDAGITISNYVVPQFVSISAGKGSEGVHHATVAVCDKDTGQVDTADMTLNVMPVHNVIAIAKKKPTRQGGHNVKFKNPNDDSVSVYTNVGSVTIPANGKAKVIAGRGVDVKWKAWLGTESARAGKGKVKFSRSSHK